VDRAHAEARAAIAAPRYTAFLLTADLRLGSDDWVAPGAVLDRPVPSLAQSMLRRRHRKLLKLGRGHHALKIEELHEIRIAAKKMRYVAEFFRSLYSRKLARRYLGRLSKLQDRLGTLNDAVTGRSLLAELLPGSGLDPSDSARASGLVLGWQAGRIHADLAVFGGEWEDFRELRPFWAAR
jgi:CHAD domain-containing protein